MTKGKNIIETFKSHNSMLILLMVSREDVFIIYSELAERVMPMSIYELLMIAVAVIRLIIDIIRLHKENKKSRPASRKS